MPLRNGARKEKTKAMIIKPINFAEIANLKTENTEDVISGLLRRRRIAMVAGDPGLGKSTFVEQLVLCAAAGKPFMGRTIAPGKIIYCNMEVEDSAFFDRFRTLAEQEGLDPAAIENIDLISMETGCEIKDLTEGLIQAYRGQNISLVVIDPMYSIIARMGDVNSLGTTTAFTNEIKKMKQELDCSVILVHHFKKHDGYTSAEATMQLMNGSYGLSYMANLIITLNNAGNITGYDKTLAEDMIDEDLADKIDSGKKVKVVVSKISDFGAVKPVIVPFIDGRYQHEMVETLQAKMTDKVEGKVLTKSENKILTAFETLEKQSQEITAKDLVEASGLSMGSVYNFLKTSKRLEKRGMYVFRKEEEAA